MRGVERDVVGILSATLSIVVLIVIVRNAGGVAQVISAFTSGWTGILSTLSGNTPQRG